MGCVKRFNSFIQGRLSLCTVNTTCWYCSRKSCIDWANAGENTYFLVLDLSSFNMHNTGRANLYETNRGP